MPCSKVYCVTVVGAIVAVAGAIFALFWGDIFDAVIVKVRDLEREFESKISVWNAVRGRSEKGR